VRRTALIDRLLASPSVPVISVVAPTGYGKTTLLTQWADAAEENGRRVAWLGIDKADNDPAVLVTDITAALHQVEPTDRVLVNARPFLGGSVAPNVARRVASTLSSTTGPTALVLDHTELLRDQQCRDAVAELAMHIPSRSQLVIAARDVPPVPTALLRARGDIVEIGVDDLAMDEREAAALLEGAGLRLAEAEFAELLRRTEGWPVGLYLAALALKAGSPGTNAGFAFTGDDRLMADYLRSEVLSRLSRRKVRFLTRTAVLDRMSAPLCDAVVGATNSAHLLESFERSNLLVVPLDRRAQWYRYHHLFRDLLRAELGRREPELVQQLHSRAAAWCEANGLPEMAIDQAQAAGDADQVARLVTSLTLPTYASGRADTVRRWMAWLEDKHLIEKYPPIAVFGAWVELLQGESAGAERWADVAERSSFDGELPDGSTMDGWLALLRAALCREGVERMGRDAEVARHGLAPGSQWRGPALLLEGISHLLDGDADRADRILAHTVDVAMHVGAVTAASLALAERAVVAIEHRHWAEAGALADRALEIVQDGDLGDYGPSALAHMVAARVSLHRGDVPGARENLARAARLRLALTSAIPFLAVQVRLELARAYLELADAAGARVVLREIRDILHLRPDLGVLPKQVDELRSTLDTIRGGAVGATSLTTAELRLIPLLSTHLSFPEIGERLHVSRHTVKTQAMSVYRKLGVSSRSGAIERAHEVGLLGE
jgi:LuxR family maltose regulon positive regulatory protein